MTDSDSTTDAPDADTDSGSDIEDRLEELREEASVITTVTVGDEFIAVPPELDTLSTPPDDGEYVRPAITGGPAGERWVVQTVDAGTDTVRDELPVRDEATAVREAIERAERDGLPVLPETVENRSHA